MSCVALLHIGVNTYGDEFMSVFSDKCGKAHQLSLENGIYTISITEMSFEMQRSKMKQASKKRYQGNLAFIIKKQ